jgi:hypothetical protein
VDDARGVGLVERERGLAQELHRLGRGHRPEALDLEVPGDIIEKVDPIFYSDPVGAALKAIGAS